MKYMTAVHTDVGIKKKTNQDSALIMEAETEIGNVLMAVICDGMGGLAKGEVASAALIKAFSDWFRSDLPGIVYNGVDHQAVFNSFGNIAFDMNSKIAGYGMRCGVSLGTTVVAMLFAAGRYYIMNIGDSRAYKMSDTIYQLTKDQSFVQREIDMGRMTPEEAAVSDQRNVLLQCVGASEIISPDFYSEELVSGDCFMLCSDGFRHVVTPQELFERMNSQMLTDEKSMKDTLIYFTELNKNRRETDNITALLVRVD
ncbi:MAG TPA: protein phosphatase 2C domain-containing protein [Ruminococcus sp.]|nr:protein phosphatase 2C domain-containing protein [Ruminococcus sp.]